MACHHLDINSFHYMVAVGGGTNIRCAPYATFGTQALSDSALKALEGRKACLLGQHGQIALGTTIKQAFALAIEVKRWLTCISPRASWASLLSCLKKRWGA